MPHKNALPFDPFVFQSNILCWYDQNQRVLPWRVVGNHKTDPYKVWLSEIMLQQTTVPAVIPYFLKFTATWPDVRALAAAKDEDVMAAWAGLGYYARARNLLKCARTIVEDWGGEFPQTHEDLLSLPGIGPYTASAITAIAYGKPATVVDGNIERIASRIFAVGIPYPEGKKYVHQKAGALFEKIDVWNPSKIKCYPQALMDIGAGVCTPQNPSCTVCPVQMFCQAHLNENPDMYPMRAVKKATPIRRGDVYWIQDREGNLLLHKRSTKRMLGGMTGLPTSDWDLKDSDLKKEKKEEQNLDFQAIFPDLKRIGDVYHVFTHFRLELTVWRVTIPHLKKVLELSPDFQMVNIHMFKLSDMGFPTVFLKAARLAHQGSKG